jgi:hypothetical protein
MRAIAQSAYIASVRHSEGGFCPRNPSSIIEKRGIPHFADSVRNDEVGGCEWNERKIVGMPTFKVIVEVRYWGYCGVPA